ncbi:glycerol kinase GlpK [Candidatus Bipolaricaulota bacterium]|nr:glycerol kinase GlpK [Candidatus Bipolaricaulota bacterium]
MKSKFFLGALDAGTTGVRFVILDEEARPLAAAYRPISLRFPQPGWVEQDPEEFVMASLTTIREALSEAGLKPSQLAGFGLTNQRETVVVWDRKTAKPLAPAIVWQDRRTAARCQELRTKAAVSREIREKTGLLPDPYFSATKLEWLFQREPDLLRRAQAGDVLVGTVDSWLLFSLTGNHATDHTNAARTMLFDLRSLCWDDELCQLFSVPRQALPMLKPSLSVFGYTRREIFGVKIPVAGVLGDQQAALLGQACLEKGGAKVTWGTGAFLLVNTGEEPVAPPEGILLTVAYTAGDTVRYALEGSIFVAGAAVQWLRDGLGLIRSSQETEELALSLRHNEGVYFVPALTGLGAPYWDPYARGVFLGLTRGTTRAHLARAALEAIAYQTYDLAEIFASALPWPIPELRVDGGAAKNNFLCQFQADILGKPVLRPVNLETTALGAAFACGWTLGLWSPEDIRRLWKMERLFQPTMPVPEREKLLRNWRRAVERAKGWAEEE